MWTAQTPMPLNLIGTKTQDWESRSIKYLIETLGNIEACSPPPKTDFSLWQYKHFINFTSELNSLVIALADECKCVDMKALDFLYLCASHSPPKQCCALDYIVHTLDSATTTLTSSKFPSATSVPAASARFDLFNR